jgi:hypothetical protein
MAFYQTGLQSNGRQEEELAISIKKALTPEETAPKQKHVRACILYTWDIKGPGSFFSALKSFPMLGDEIISFKALTVYHKVIRQGHPNVLFMLTIGVKKSIYRFFFIRPDSKICRKLWKLLYVQNLYSILAID